MESETPSTALSVTGGCWRRRQSRLSASTKCLETPRASSSGVWMVPSLIDVWAGPSLIEVLHVVVAPAAGRLPRPNGQQLGGPAAALVRAQRAALVEAAARRRIDQPGRRAGDGRQVARGGVAPR